MQIPVISSCKNSQQVAAGILEIQWKSTKMEADAGFVVASMLLILLHKRKLRRKQRKKGFEWSSRSPDAKKFRDLPFLSQRIGIGGHILLQKLFANGCCYVRKPAADQFLACSCIVPILILLQFRVIEARVPQLRDFQLTCFLPRMTIRTWSTSPFWTESSPGNTRSQHRLKLTWYFVSTFIGQWPATYCNFTGK